jgi:TPR repeat protein
MCSAISAFSQKDYDRFIHLVREESMSSRKGGGRHFLLYTNNENRSRAFTCLQAKADGATPEAQMDLYWVLQSAPQRISASPTHWLMKAAQSGLPSAQYRVSEQILLHYGHAGSAPSELFGELTIERYKEWLSKAAEAGLPEAQFRLGQYYEGLRSAFGPYAPDANQAIKWYTRAAAQSEDEWVRDDAHARLGHIYFLGKIVPRNYEEALRWYKQIALEKTQNPCANRLVNVRFNMMIMYRDGLGVEMDPVKAKELSKVSFGCQ